MTGYTPRITNDLFTSAAGVIADYLDGGAVELSEALDQIDALVLRLNETVYESDAAQKHKTEMYALLLAIRRVIVSLRKDNPQSEALTIARQFLTAFRDKRYMDAVSMAGIIEREQTA